MRAPLVLTLFLVSLMLGSGLSFAGTTPDTAEARMAATETYFKYYPLNEMVDWMLKEVVAGAPVDQQKAYRDTLMKNIHWGKIEPLAKHSMVNRLTLDEINSLVGQVKRPEGKAALQKMRLYESDLMPTMNEELEKAIRMSAPRGK